MSHAYRRTVVISTVTLLFFAASAAWVSGQEDDLMFRRTRDPKIISKQIKAALPTLQRGFAMLTSSTDPENTAAAVGLLHDTYRYLRAAQESSEVLQSISKFPDPLIALRNRKILDVRDRLLGCWSNRSYLAEPGAIRTRCIAGLQVAVRELRVVVAAEP